MQWWHAHEACLAYSITRRWSILEISINTQGGKWTSESSRNLFRKESQVATPGSGSRTDENYLQKELPTLSMEILKTSLLLGHQVNERKGQKVSGTEDGGLWRHHFWREGGELEDHIPWMLDGEEKKRSKPIEIKGPMETKGTHKIRRHVHLSLSSQKAPIIKETTLPCTKKTHTNWET